MKNCPYCGKVVKYPYTYCNNTCHNNYRYDQQDGKLTDFTVTCHKCNKEFVVTEREKLFPQKNKYYCSRSCANSRNHSQETKNKTRITILKGIIPNNIFCLNCGKEFYAVPSAKRKFCSSKCSIIYLTLNKPPDYFSNIGKIGGRISASKQIRISKNEIYFAELCMENFKNILLNMPIFNGWDADVILTDHKIAVLWNGIWHYKHVTRKYPLKQIQSRDKIKIHEIENAGYIPYVIKDMGRYNKKFVESEFEKFKNWWDEGGSNSQLTP